MGSLERPDNVVKADYGARASNEYYRQNRTGFTESEESSPRGELRQSLGPEPEVVHVPQPTRRLGWFATGFMIASALGIVIGALVVVGLPSILGKRSGASTHKAELASTSPQAANSAGPVGPVANPRAVQSSSQVTSAPAVPPSSQPASSAPARVANLGSASETAATVRGVTDSEIRFGISAPFSGPAKELGQNMKLGIEAAFNAANANGGVNWTPASARRSGRRL